MLKNPEGLMKKSIWNHSVALAYFIHMEYESNADLGTRLKNQACAEKWRNKGNNELQRNKMYLNEITFLPNFRLSCLTKG